MEVAPHYDPLRVARHRAGKARVGDRGMCKCICVFKSK